MKYQTTLNIGKKELLWLIPIVCAILLTVVIIKTSYKHDICGDGICQSKEIVNGTSFCDLDCKKTCPTGGDVEQQCSVGWQGVYLNLIEKGNISKDYLAETEEIDFSNQEIQNLALSLKRDSIKDTARAIALWTYTHIMYDNTDEYNDCYGMKASEILERGSGVCSTMSKLNIALLRADGIPAFSDTGCLQFNTACKLKQTFFRLPFPKFASMQVDSSGNVPTMGYLHNWVMIPLYEDGKIEMVILESTSGLLYEDSCINYRVYYQDPGEGETCGLNQFDPNVRDCEQW